MLNIPEEVKTLFKADSVFKNFHVHFPNGEYTDLNNDDIVSESVEFTESLCSQQAFRFGLTEASEIKFTCVNVPNIRGAVIECAIEIQADSLGAEWLAEHAPTGTEDFLDPQVCTYSDRTMYRVPYGRFIVDTCPRNHETMYKRDVTGYTERMDDAETMNPGQVAFMASYFPYMSKYATRIKPLVNATLYNSNPAALSNIGYRLESLTNYGSYFTLETDLTLKTSDGTASTYHFMLNYYTYYYLGDRHPQTSIYRVDWSSQDPSDYDLIGKLGRELKNHFDIDYSLSGYETMEELVKAGTKGITGHYMQIPFLIGGSTSQSGEAFYSIPYGTRLVYAYMSGESTPVYANKVTSVAVYKSTIEDGFTAVNGGVEFSVYADRNSNEDLAQYVISFNSTLQTEKKNSDGTAQKYYSFANAFSLSDIVQGYLELQCRFGSPSRSGGMEITALDNTSPVSILPENYAELWYDETTIAPIGYVQVKFKDETDNEQDLTVQIGTGASVYDLRDNAVLQNMVFTVSKAEAEAGVTIESKLLAFLNSVFTPNIPDLTFIPIELTKKGLPYLEAGDAVTITTGDGQVVPSFILRQTVKGIQFLTADVESANGEAVEMVET